MKHTLLILALFGLAPAAVPAQTPSLADVARQERARQKNLTSKIQVTNKTLGSELAAPELPASAKAEEKPATPADVTHDEKWWRDAFKVARDDVKRAEDKVQVLKLELNKLNMDLLTRDDIFNKEGQLGPKLTLKNAELAAAEKEAEKARQKVTQLDDELRRSGSPVGWSR